MLLFADDLKLDFGGNENEFEEPRCDINNLHNWSVQNALLQKNVVFTELKSTKPKNNLENCYRDENMLLFHLDNFDGLLITETWLTFAIKNGQLMLSGSNRQT